MKTFKQMLPQEKINCCFLFLFLDNKPYGTLKKNNKKQPFPFCIVY